MKAVIHPNWHPEAQVTCGCGNTFTIGSTAEKIHIEVCFACHPFYTGESRFVDVKGRVDRFRELQTKGGQKNSLSKKDRRQAKKQQKIQEELELPENLTQLRKNK